MKWINERNPESPGMYAVRMYPINLPSSFMFGYFDGNGWQLASEAGEKLIAYRGNPEWSVIDWGKDE